MECNWGDQIRWPMEITTTFVQQFVHVPQVIMKYMSLKQLLCLSRVTLHQNYNKFYQFWSTYVHTLIPIGLITVTMMMSISMILSWWVLSLSLDCCGYIIYCTYRVTLDHSNQRSWVGVSLNIHLRAWLKPHNTPSPSEHTKTYWDWPAKQSLPL